MEERARERWVRHDRESRSGGDRAHGAEACGERVDHDAPAARAARGTRALHDLGRTARNVREVQRVPASLAVGPRDRLAAALDPLAKRRRRLIRQTVIVLDEIDPPAGESVGQLCKLGRPATEWLARRAEQGSPAGARELPEPGDAEPRATQRGEQLVRPLEAGDQDPCLERDVAEQKVQELRQVAAYGARVERNHGTGATAAERLDGLDASRDPQRDLRRRSVRWELDGLLERDVLRPGGGEPTRE